MPGPTAQAQTFDDLGYRYAFDLFPTADHFALAANDSYQPAADFLGTQRVNRNPAHVTYVVNPTMDFANRDTVADHAYWLSGLRLRDAVAATRRSVEVDAISGGFGKGDPVPSSTEVGAGTLPPGNLGPLAYTEQRKVLGPDAEGGEDELGDDHRDQPQPGRRPPAPRAARLPGEARGQYRRPADASRSRAASAGNTLRLGVEAEPEPVQGPQPEPALAARGDPRRRAGCG